MVCDLDFLVEVVVVLIVCEDDGLVMSSCNVYLIVSDCEVVLVFLCVLNVGVEIVFEGLSVVWWVVCLVFVVELLVLVDYFVWWVSSVWLIGRLMLILVIMCLCMMVLSMILVVSGLCLLCMSCCWMFLVSR